MRKVICTERPWRKWQRGWVEQTVQHEANNLFHSR